MSKKEYELRLHDTFLLAFSLETKCLDGLSAEIIYIEDSKGNLFPIGLETTNEGILDWLNKRVIPDGREYKNEILNTLSVKSNVVQEIIDLSFALSLNDSYWVVPAGSNKRFCDYNFFENEFNSEISAVALTGSAENEVPQSLSPELTTNGMLRKAWRRVEGAGIYLYKGGSQGFANTGNEPYNEYYASQIANAMGIACVEYDLETWHSVLCSKCKLFTNISQSYVPMSAMLSEKKCDTTLFDCIEHCEGLGSDFAQQLRSMLVFDALIYNEDRHFGNFGFLRNNLTGNIEGFAPIFDNGLSLFNYAMQDDFAELEEYAKTRTNPYSISFDEICKEALGDKQKEQLSQLKNFRFKRHERHNLPEWRPEALEHFLQARARQLLSLK